MNITPIAEDAVGIFKDQAETTAAELSWMKQYAKFRALILQRRLSDPDYDPREDQNHMVSHEKNAKSVIVTRGKSAFDRAVRNTIELVGKAL